MRSSPRLSFFAACCTAAMMCVSLHAANISYSLPGDAALLKNITIRNNTYFSAKDQYIESQTFPNVITNITLTGHRTDTGNRRIRLTAGSYDYTIKTDEAIAQGNANKVFFCESIDVTCDATSFKLYCRDVSGYNSGNIYISQITVYTIDPELPKIEAIANQTVGSLNSSSLTLPVSSYYGDSLTVSVVATNEQNEAVVNGVNFNSSTYALTFTPSEAGITSGAVTFTVTATGTEGSVSRSFSITVEEGVVKTPPTIDAIANQSILALRTLTVPFIVHEADGDPITTNAPTVVPAGVLQGHFGYDANGNFYYTPEIADAVYSPVTFTISVTDDQGTAQKSFEVAIGVGTPPLIGAISPKEVAYGIGVTNRVSPVITATDGDVVTASNVVVKVGTQVPAGYVVFENGVAKFSPAEADIGNTFTFTASATDLDGTTNIDFNVSVILAKPVLKHCPVDDWTPTSFTADIQAPVPGATSYNLRRINSLPDGTKTTQTVNNVTFPYVFTDLPSTNQHYWAQAVCGNVVSAWSEEQTIGLHNWLPFVSAVVMTGASHGSYVQDFNSLPSSGSGTWNDGRTLPGWYVSFAGSSFADGTIQTWKYGANNTATGFFSFGTEKGVDANRGIGVKNSKWADDFRFGVAFTNTCQYAVTNINVAFTACQFRYGKGYTQLQLSHVVSDSVKSITSSSSDWKDDEDFFFDPDLTQNAAAMDPQYTRHFSGDIALTGNDALQPGQILMLRWKNVAENNSVPVGIDDLEVKWQCAWPRHTVIYLR